MDGLHGTSSPSKTKCPECGKPVREDGTCTGVKVGTNTNPRRLNGTPLPIKRSSGEKTMAKVKSLTRGKKVEIISPDNARRAHRRRLPGVIKMFNALLRDGHRIFTAGANVNPGFTDGMYPFVVRAFRRQKGWMVHAKNDSIQVWIPGDPIPYWKRD